MSEVSVEGLRVDLAPGDVIFDTSYGVARPYAYLIVEISKSWFRRKKPYLVSNTFNCGQVVSMRDAGPYWMPQAWIIAALIGNHVAVSRPGVGQIYPLVTGGENG